MNNNELQSLFFKVLFLSKYCMFQLPYIVLICLLRFDHIDLIVQKFPKLGLEFYHFLR